MSLDTSDDLNDGDDWDADFGDSDIGQNVKKPSLTLTHEVRGIAANPNQKEEGWDDFFEFEAAGNEQTDLVAHSLPLDGNISFGRQTGFALRISSQIISPTKQSKKELKPVRSYERALFELKYLIHCVPVPELSFGSYAFCTPELFAYRPDESLIKNKALADIVETFSIRIEEIAQANSSVALVSELKKLAEDISDQITSIDFQDMKEDQINSGHIRTESTDSSALSFSGTPAMNAFVNSSEVPVFTPQKLTLASGLAVALSALYYLSALAHLFLAHAANVFADVGLKKSSLQRACEDIAQIPIDENVTPLRALIFIEMGFFHNLDDSNELALLMYNKAIRTLLLDSCQCPHHHTSKCVPKTLSWSLLLASLFGSIKTIESIALQESNQASTESRISNFSSSMLTYFLPFLTADSRTSLFDFTRAVPRNIHRESFLPQRTCDCSHSLSNALKEINTSAGGIISTLIEYEKKTKEDKKSSNGDNKSIQKISLLFAMQNELDTMTLRFTQKNGGLAKSSSQMFGGMKTAFLNQNQTKTVKSPHQQRPSKRSPETSRQKNTVLETESWDNFEIADRELPKSEITKKSSDDSNEDENWDIEMNINTDIQEGALASLIFPSMLTSGQEKSVPQKAKLLENADAHKVLQITKFPPVSQLFRIKLNTVMHEKELESFLTKIIKKRIMDIDEIDVFDNRRVRLKKNYNEKTNLPLSNFSLSVLDFSRTNTSTRLHHFNTANAASISTSTSSISAKANYEFSHSGEFELSPQTNVSDTLSATSTGSGHSQPHSHFPSPSLPLPFHTNIESVLTLITSEQLLLNSQTLSQPDNAWANAVSFIIFVCALGKNFKSKEEKVVLFEGLYSLTHSIAKLWSFSKQSSWKKILKAIRKNFSTKTLRIQLLEQETYCHTIMENDEQIFEEWSEHSFEPDPVHFFCSIATKGERLEKTKADTETESEIENELALARALALSDLTLFLFAVSPLTCATKHGNDDPFELVKDCCNDPNILNPILRQNLLCNLYDSIPLNHHKAKVCLSIALHSIQSDNWIEAEKQTFETIVILDKVKQPGCHSAIVSELGALSLRKYGEVLIKNGKYQYGILCFEAAVHVYELRHKKDAFALMLKSADLAAQHDDSERAISAYNHILLKYQQDKKANESIFVAQTLSQLHLDMGSFFQAVSVLNDTLKKSSQFVEFDFHKLKLEVQLAQIFEKCFNSDKAIEILERYNVNNVPKHQRMFFLLTLGKAYSHKLWLEEFFFAITMLKNSEGHSLMHDHSWSASRELIPRSWRLSIKYFLLAKQYRKAFFITDLIAQSIPQEHILLRGKFLLLRGKALYGLWSTSEPQHFPSSFFEKPTELGEIIQQMARFAQRTDHSSSELIFTKPSDILQETLKCYQTAISLFSAAGDERKELSTSLQFVELILDHIFPSVALLKRPINQLLNMPKFATSSLVENDSGNSEKEEEYVISLELLNHYLGKILDFASETVHITFELECLLCFAELRFLENEIQSSIEFWTLWKDMFCKLFIFDKRSIPQSTPLYFVEYFYKSTRRGVRLLFSFDKGVISRNLSLIDIFLNVEREYNASLKRSFVPNEKIDDPKQRLDSIKNLCELLHNDPAKNFTRRLWSGLYSIKEQIKKHASGKLSLEKLQNRNRSALRSLLDCAKSAQKMFRERDIREYDRSKLSEHKMVYIIQLGQLVVYYSPSNGRIQVDRFGSHSFASENTQSDIPSLIHVRVSSGNNALAYADFVCSNNMTVSSFLSNICAHFENDAFRKREKKSFFTRKFDFKLVTCNTSFHNELEQLKLLLVPSSVLSESTNTTENDLTTLSSTSSAIKFSKLDSTSWSSLLSLVKPKGSLQPIPEDLPLSQCFSVTEVKYSSEGHPLPLRIVGKASKDQSNMKSNLITFSAQTLSFMQNMFSARKSSNADVTKEDKKVASEVKRELQSLFSSLSYVIKQPFQNSEYGKEDEKENKQKSKQGKGFILLCSQSLHFIPWEFILPNVIRFSSMFDMHKSIELSKTSKYDYKHPNFFLLMRPDGDGIHDFDDSFILKWSTASLFMSNPPSYSRTIAANCGQPFVSSVHAQYASEWKKISKNPKKTKPIIESTSEEHDEMHLFDLNSISSSFSQVNFKGKPVLILSCVDLLDWGDYLHFFVRYFGQCTILFVPSTKNTIIIDKILKHYRKQKVFEKKGKLSKANEKSLPELVNALGNKLSIPIILFNYL